MTKGAPQTRPNYEAGVKAIDKHFEASCTECGWTGSDDQALEAGNVLGLDRSACPKCDSLEITDPCVRCGDANTVTEVCGDRFCLECSKELANRPFSEPRTVSVFAPQIGDQFEHASKGVCTFIGAVENRYKMRMAKTCATLIIWKTELPRYWKPIQEQKYR